MWRLFRKNKKKTFDFEPIKHEKILPEFAVLSDKLPTADPELGRPYIFSSGQKLFLYYAIKEDFPGQTYANTIKSSGHFDSVHLIALVYFEDLLLIKNSYSGNAFTESKIRGIKPNQMHSIENSTWLFELIQSGNIPKDSKTNYKHFIFPFQDHYFQCIAKGFRNELYRTSMEALTKELGRKAGMI